ncbi:exported hypothetical protein [Candidatus Zixiibacteriota bacterium]|nr:exported hypothetical protein [candidate division Zixibacteria bacterium]
MRGFVLTILLFLAGAGAMAQETAPVDSTPDTNALVPVPLVKFETENYFLTKAFYPDYRADEHEIWQDIFDVEKKAAPLLALWQIWGDSILRDIEIYSGIPWKEPGIKIHLMKYLPVPGLYEPLAIPIIGIKQGLVIEAPASGYHQLLVLIQYLAGRNLLQVEYPSDTLAAVSNHPLLDQGPYRFDVMAVAVALSAARRIIPEDSLVQITSSAVWKRQFPGWGIYKNYFRDKWVLSPSTPLLQYLQNEPYNSTLVAMTAPPDESSPEKSDSGTASQSLPASSSVGGRLGFFAERQRGGIYRVTAIDSTKLAYSCGLRLGDQIRSVNGLAAGTFSALIGDIIDRLSGDGAYLEISRAGEIKGILIQAH